MEKRVTSARLMPGAVPDLKPDYCPVCREIKPIEEWIGQDFDLGPEAIICCRTCRQKGRPKPELAEIAALTRNEREIIRDMLTLGSATAVARKHGVRKNTVVAWFEGKNRPQIRRAYQRLLEAEGLDAGTLGRLAKALLCSVRAQWNHKDGEWDLFPDNATRATVWKYLTKLHHLEPMHDEETGGPAVAVFIDTNLGSGEREAVPGRYEIDVTPERP